MNALRRSIAVLLIVTITAMYVCMPLTALAQSEPVIVQNRFVQTATNPDNGRFSISTLEGSPYREKDQESSLLFSGKDTESSFTTFKVNGVDYIYGNDYSYKGLGSSFISKPEKSGLLTLSKCRIGDLEISQLLELNDNVENPQVGNVKISYSVENKGENISTVGTRILLDTKLGENDGAPFLLPGEDTALRTEKEFKGSEVPAYWRAMDSPENPEVVGYGIIAVPSRQKPDKLIMGHWNALSNTKWDYTVNTERQFSSVYNDYKSADSAVALYWDPMEIKPGETKTFETYYGLGELIPDQEGDFGLSVLAPDKLNVKDGKYAEQQFKVTAEIDNTLSKSAAIGQLKVALELPSGLSLAEGETAEKTVEFIPKGKLEKVEWLVVPASSQELRVMEARVRVHSEVVKERTKSKFIILPGIGGELPQVYYQDYIPKLMHGKDKSKAIYIMGKGFSLLNDLSKLDVYLVNKNNGEKLYISDEYISIVNDNRLTARIPSDLDIGSYTVNIKHEAYGEFNFGTQLGISYDDSLLARQYEILAISKTDEGEYTAKMQDTEANLGDAALVIRGKVREVTKDNEYEVIPSDTVTINSVVKYKGGSLQVYKEGGLFKIKGDGTLRLNSKIAGNKLDIKLFEGKFILDSKNLSFEPEPGYVNKEEVEKVGILPLVIKSTRFDGEDGVYVNADLDLSMGQLDKLLDENPYGYDMKGPLDNMHFNSNGIIYEAKVPIPFPKWKLGSFESKEKKITLLINIAENKYGIQAAMMNRPMKLMDIETTLMLKDWVPDYLEFSNDYGETPRPIGSTGLGFKKIGGGIYGIYKLWEDKYPATTIKATCDIVDLVSKNIKGYSLITGKDLSTSVNMNGIKLDGDGYVYFLHVGNIKGEFEYDNGGYIQANLNLLDILIAEAYISITKDSFTAYAEGELQFPDSVPFIGGEDISSFTAGISSEKVWGSAGFLGCDVGVTYYWEDNDFDFDVDVDWLGMTGDGTYTANGKGLYSTTKVTPEGKKARVVYGSNIERVEDNRLYAYVGDIRRLHMGQSIAMAELKREHLISVNGLETALLKVAYTGTAPVLSVTKPDGKPYELRPKTDGEVNPNYVNQIIKAEDSATGKEEKNIYIVAQNPENGSWLISSDKDVEVALYNVKEAPKFESLQITEPDAWGNRKVKWELSTAKDSLVSLYLVRSGDKSNAVLLRDNIAASEGEADISKPEDAGTGMYSIMAKVTRGDFGYDVACTESFQLNKPLAADTNGFKVEAVGNGRFRLNWEIPYGKIPYGYYLQVVDKDGNPDTTAGETIKVNNGDILGGISEDASGKPYGWLTNRDYYFTLTEYEVNYKYVDGEYVAEEHLLTPVISDKFFLPAPEPPDINVTMSSLDGTIADAADMGGVETKLTSGEIAQLDIGLDKAANLEIWCGDKYEHLQPLDGNQYTARLSLSEGINDIEIKATSENGDMSVKHYKVICDTEAPYLMVESPSASQSVEGDKLTVSGRTEANAIVTIDGEQAEVGTDGSFRKDIALSGVMSRTVNIKATDAAGNSTSYRGEAWNSNAAGTAGVFIKLSDNKVESGAQKQLELYSRTSGGKEFRIASDAVKWEVVGGQDAASISDSGLLYGKSEGEAVVKASYKISGGYSLEDAVAVSVSRQVTEPTPTPAPTPTPTDNKNDHDDDDKKDHNTDNHVNNSTENEKEVEINPNGVTVIELSGRIRIEIPQGSLPNGSHVRVKEVKNTLQNPDAGSMTPVGSCYEIEVVGSEAVLKKPARVIIYFGTDNRLESNKLGIYRYNEEYKEWELTGGRADMQNGTITVDTGHFSTYGVFCNSRLTVMKDMENHWARDAVNRLVLEGIINGISSGNGEFSFKPEDYITRAEFAKLLASVNGFDMNNETADLEYELKDRDKVPAWAKPYIAYCYRNKWISGSPQVDGTYIMPDKFITRAEAAAMLGRTLNSFRFEECNFTDKDSLPEWAQEYVKIVTNLKIMEGYPDNSFKPDKIMTRAEAAALFDNYLKFKQ